MRTHAAQAMLLVLGLMPGAACRPAPEVEASPATVRVASVERATLTEWLELTGRVVPPPDHEASVAPRVAGRILAVHVVEGDMVRAGQSLAQVEPANLDDALASAEASLGRAAADAEFRRAVARRSEALLEKGVVSRQELESDRAAAAAAEATQHEADATLATARRQRSWADLAAPFDGVVVRIARHAGDDVDGSPATPVVEIAGVRNWEIAADAAGDALARLAPEQDALIDAGAAAVARPARITKVARAVDSATGTGAVRLHPQGEGTDLPLGAAVRVRIALARHAQALAVPASALRRNASGESEVVVVEAGHAKIRAVTTGLLDAGRVEILSGLKGGEVVVVEDPLALSDGVEVRGGHEPVDSER